MEMSAPNEPKGKINVSKLDGLWWPNWAASRSLLLWSQVDITRTATQYLICVLSNNKTSAGGVGWFCSDPRLDAFQETLHVSQTASAADTPTVWSDAQPSRAVCTSMHWFPLCMLRYTQRCSDMIHFHQAEQKSMDNYHFTPGEGGGKGVWR